MRDVPRLFLDRIKNPILSSFIFYFLMLHLGLFTVIFGLDPRPDNVTLAGFIYGFKYEWWQTSVYTALSLAVITAADLILYSASIFVGRIKSWLSYKIKETNLEGAYRARIKELEGELKLFVRDNEHLSNTRLIIPMETAKYKNAIKRIQLLKPNEKISPSDLEDIKTLGRLAEQFEINLTTYNKWFPDPR